MDPAVGSETVEVDSPGSPSPNSDQDQDRDQDGGLCPVRQRSEPPGRPKSVRPRGRPAAANAARERSRVQTLRNAFLELQRTLPSVPPDTKLSKLDVLILATTYIAHLTRTLEESLEEGGEEGRRPPGLLHSLKVDGYLHPVKKWPMRSRLYVGANGPFLNSGPTDSQNPGETSKANAP
ncbi:transcription factor 24 [Callorhinchus milii]|uniref:transcription factor 24 n=1 Tax=Callorhinchus milii TaxID=7868 RepID=UPI0004575C52|nr:transcription factor 24 [Callorhinchus milii]|eukprot:gi/632940816/ref/XP_007885518.1/ PREDICTED: transcription factor 24 [Callorhinchus milii]